MKYVFRYLAQNCFFLRMYFIFFSKIAFSQDIWSQKIFCFDGISVGWGWVEWGGWRCLEGFILIWVMMDRKGTEWRFSKKILSKKSVQKSCQKILSKNSMKKIVFIFIFIIFLSFFWSCILYYSDCVRPRPPGDRFDIFFQVATY